MDHLSLLGIAVGLAMDAFAVSVANGAAARRVKPAFALKLAVSFGVFQSLMPFIGWLVGKAGEAIISSVDHWIALILLGFLGIQMLREARKRDDGDETLQEDVPWRRVLTLAVATSIDALATGVLLPSAVGADTVARMLLSVGEIGLVTLVLCFFGRLPRAQIRRASAHARAGGRRHRIDCDRRQDLRGTYVVFINVKGGERPLPFPFPFIFYRCASLFLSYS